MFQGIRDGSRKCQSSRDSLTHWALEAALIGRMAERERKGLLLQMVDR